jgi:hypothetical protein
MSGDSAVPLVLLCPAQLSLRSAVRTLVSLSISNSPHLTLPHLILPHVILPHVILPHLILPRLTLLHISDSFTVECVSPFVVQMLVYTKMILSAT